jgi:hypothetical protein
MVLIPSQRDFADSFRFQDVFPSFAARMFRVKFAVLVVAWTSAGELAVQAESRP